MHSLLFVLVFCAGAASGRFHAHMGKRNHEAKPFDEYAWAKRDHEAKPFNENAWAKRDDEAKPWTTAYRAKHDAVPDKAVKDAEEPEVKPFNYLFTADGKIYVDGQPIKPAPSTNDKHYPAKDGWDMWIFKKITFYMKREGGKFEIIPVAQKKTNQRVTTPDGVTHEFFVTNADGRVFAKDGKEMDLSVSNNKGHPAKDGWKMFDHEGDQIFFNVNDGHFCTFLN